MLEDDLEIAEIESELDDILEEESLPVSEKKTPVSDLKEDDLYSEDEEENPEEMESLDEYDDIEDLEIKHGNFDGDSDDF
jgi:hypothetical protein